MSAWVVGAVSALLLMTATAQAHVTIWPQESQAGGSERYMLRVPAEGALTITSVELEVPVGVTILLVGAPTGWTYDLLSENGRIVSIRWTMNIKPGEFAEFAFIARNPNATEIVWRAHQYMEDGSVVDFTGRRGDPAPGPVTRLTPLRR
jgi:uncharacterized protein YcnI